VLLSISPQIPSQREVGGSANLQDPVLVNPAGQKSPIRVLLLSCVQKRAAWVKKRVHCYPLLLRSVCLPLKFGSVTHTQNTKKKWEFIFLPRCKKQMLGTRDLA
jgi:hypothetical protein